MIRTYGHWVDDAITCYEECYCYWEGYCCESFKTLCGVPVSTLDDPYSPSCITCFYLKLLKELGE